MTGGKCYKHLMMDRVRQIWQRRRTSANAEKQRKKIYEYTRQGNIYTESADSKPYRPSADLSRMQPHPASHSEQHDQACENNCAKTEPFPTRGADLRLWHWRRRVSMIICRTCSKTCGGCGPPKSK